jgi:hypothetical protein
MVLRNCACKPPVEATEAWWGIVKTDRVVYLPLDTIEVSIRAPLNGADRYRVVLHDGDGLAYAERVGALEDGEAAVSFIAGGREGMQFLKVWFDAAEGAPHHRLLNLYVEADTSIVCDNQAISGIYEMTKRSMRLNRRKYTLPEGVVVGYTTADSGSNLDYWIRDMYYSMGGFALWESDITSGFQANWARQSDDGHFPDWVTETGEADRMTSESDVEYIAALALERVWMLTGDCRWLARYLPQIERGLCYLTSNGIRWDGELGLVKRGHTCDTWDFDIDTDRYVPGAHDVAATCDQSGLYAALLAVSRMCAFLGDGQKAEEYRLRAEELQQRCRVLLWDGEKFKHHLHLAFYDHRGFDESDQLAMGNGWAMTRRLADHDQCLRILDTYLRRWEETGAPFPWWSLQPGYPVEQGRVLQENEVYLRPGGYCNGALMPWVGAALCQAAYRHGRGELGFKLLLDYANFLCQQEGKLYTWYWPDMQPGFRTTTRNTTGHDGWSLGHWMDALTEGLVGFRIASPGMETVELSPRWESGQIRSVRVVLQYPGADRYFAYRYDRYEQEIRLVVTGTADSVQLDLPLPGGCVATGVSVNGQRWEYQTASCYGARHVQLMLKGSAVSQVVIAFSDGSPQTPGL